MEPSDSSHHDHDHGHDHDHDHDHGHTHGVIDPSIATTERGIWAVKWSFVGLMTTAILQVFVVWLSGSVALLADTIHNFGDASTAIPLWIAFSLARLRPNKRFPYGYGRVEDLAGVAVVFTILFSAIVAGYESIQRFFNPQEVSYLGALVVASVVGFLGNELVAVFRIRVGREINSVALVADGYHARVDGFTSLAVLFGALGIWLGYPLADPLIGLLITLAILRIVWQSARSIFVRMLDGVEPEVIDEIRNAAHHTEGVRDVAQVRARWLGHRMHVEINIAVDAELSVQEGHDIATELRHQLLHQLQYLANATIHVDPLHASGEEHHSIVEHVHDDLPAHSHQ
jgi:cation diffusion facilitator family transporter